MFNVPISPIFLFENLFFFLILVKPLLFFLHGTIAWNITYHLFTFNLFMFGSKVTLVDNIKSNHVSSIVPFFCFLIGEFNPVMVKVITSKERIASVISYFFICPIHFVPHFWYHKHFGV